MEAETLLAMKTYIMEELLASPIDLPSDFYDSATGNKIQEWDGILISENTLYLLEAKHSMSIQKVKKLADRIKSFPQTLQRSAKMDFPVKFNKIVGVACGTFFPQVSRNEAHRLGLMVVYPSGHRYLVESGRADSPFALER